VPGQLQLVSVERQDVRGGRSRVVQHPPQCLFPQARGQQEKSMDLLVAQRCGPVTGMAVAQTGDGVGLDPALLAPPADGAAQRGQLTVGGAGVG
jgi:hypothetical protein